MKLTPADTQLLTVLRENARASTAEIARRLNLSRTTVQSRIERLEREGVIGGYTVRVSDAAEHGHIRAHIMITVLPKQMATVVEALHAMPEVRVLHSVSGPHRAGRGAFGVGHGPADRSHRRHRRRGADDVLDHPVGEVRAVAGSSTSSSPPGKVGIPHLVIPAMGAWTWTC